MHLTPDIYADLFRQCAFISALIAGFSFAFLGFLLASVTRDRIVDWVAAFSIASTAGLVVCALGWTFAAPRIAMLAGGLAPNAPFELPETLRSIHRSLSMTFIACFVMFLVSLGLSGWIRSRVLGAVSTAIASAALLFALWIMSFFIQ